MKKWRVAAGAVVVLSVVAVIPAHERLLAGYAALLRVDNARPGADLILILSGRPQSRVPKAIDLYRRGFARSLMVTRACDSGAPPASDNQYTVMRAIAAREGVAIPMVGAPTEAESTYDEAYQAAAYVKVSGARRLIVVTDAFHTARARYAFEKVFREQGVGARVEFAAAEASDYDDARWWQSRIGLYDYLSEPVKLAYYALR